MDYMAQVPLTHARRPKCCLHSTRTIRPVSKVPRSTGRRGFCGGERCLGCRAAFAQSMSPVTN